jgi:DNA-binding response OmpR family regulator
VPHKPIVAAVFNTSPDIVELIRHAFEPAGMVVVTLLTYDIREGKVDLDNFLNQHDPNVVVYDIAPPYDSNWNMFLHVRGLKSMQGRKIVITSINPKHVARLAGRDTKIYEIVGKPLDLNRLTRAVKEALRERPSSR